MRKVDLTMKEHEAYTIIKKLVLQHGNKQRAAMKLNCSVRHINRMIQGYYHCGKEFFSHGNKARKPINKLSEQLENNVIELYKEKYNDASFRHFCELLEEVENLQLSESTVRNWLKKHDIISPEAHRATKKAYNKRLRERLKNPLLTRKEKKEIIHALLVQEEAHPRRPRCKNAGEMIQMDASEFILANGDKCYLHAAIDDASGGILGAFFDHYETLKGYYHVVFQILHTYGIPYMFYTDKRTVFEYTSKKKMTSEQHTHFACACNHLGIDIKTTSIPQAKGRIERLFKSLKSRLRTLIRLHTIETIEQANKFIAEYIHIYNARFAQDVSRIPSVFEKAPSLEEINLTLSRITKRTLDRGSSIKYNNSYYIPVNANNEQCHFRHGTKALVIESFDTSLFVNIDDRFYALQEIPHAEVASRYFYSEQQQPPRPYKRYIPPMTHPWKFFAYDKRLKASQKTVLR